jgi:hypothetical protein
MVVVSLTNDRPVLSSERAPHMDRTETFMSPRRSSTPRLTERQSQCDFDFESHVEAGSCTSTVALRVVGGDEKGSLESETVKYGREFHGTRTRKWLRWRGPAAIVNNRPVLSSERAPHRDRTETFMNSQTGLDIKTDWQSQCDFDLTLILGGGWIPLCQNWAKGLAYGWWLM